MSSLILVRHGQSVWNLQNRFTGWVDVELSKNGIKEAQKSGDLIKTLNLNFDLYFTSYLKRSIKTLEIILDVLKVNNPIILKAWELNERHYGGLTSLNKNEMKKKLGEDKIRKFRRSWNMTPPLMKNDDKNNPKNNPIYGKIPLNKIPNAESLQDTYNRVIHYFNKKIKQNLQEEKNIIISAHGNSLRALCKKIFKISNQKIAKLEIPTGNPLVINLSQNLKILDCKYLDEGRKKEIFFNQ